MRILLIGQNGQIGRELHAALNADPGVALIAVERRQLDLCSRTSITDTVALTAPDVVINAAAYTMVDKAENEPDLVRQVNAIGVGWLAEACKTAGATLIHYSTDYVFDGLARIPYEEDSVICPKSAYGRSKAEGESRIRDSACNHLILRTAWVYGHHGRNFMLTMLKLARAQNQLRVVSDQIGCPTWSREIAETTVALIRQSGAGAVADTVNLVSAGQTSWQGFASEIIRLGSARGLCPSVQVEPILTVDYPTPAQRPSYSVLSQTKISECYGIRMPEWRTGLRRCLDELPPVSS